MGRSRVTLTLGSVQAGQGHRAWWLRLADDNSHVELPLGVRTRPGLGLLAQTETAVLSCASAMLMELGASPVAADGSPIRPAAPGPIVSITLAATDVKERRGA